MAQCTAQAQSGRRCRAQAMTGARYCFWHNPETQAARAQARKKGGFNRRRMAGSVAVSIETPADVVAILADELGALLGRVEAGATRARAVGALCSVVLKALEVGDIEARIAALEAIQCQGVNGYGR